MATALEPVLPDRLDRVVGHRNRWRGDEAASRFLAGSARNVRHAFLLDGSRITAPIFSLPALRGEVRLGFGLLQLFVSEPVCALWITQIF